MKIIPVRGGCTSRKVMQNGDLEIFSSLHTNTQVIENYLTKHKKMPSLVKFTDLL